jgi:hypothetical protein
MIKICIINENNLKLYAKVSLLEYEDGNKKVLITQTVYIKYTD